MDAGTLEAYLHEHIPLSAAMGARVEAASPGGVALAAPLGPNLNHRATAFGGSVATLAILAGWSLVHLRLRHDGVEARTVIQRSDVTYLEPIHGDFEARAEAPDAESWRRFRRALHRWGRGRIAVRIRVLAADRVVAEMDGDYVSLSAATD